MPVDDLGKLGMRMRAARNEMGLTQQRLSDMCHVSIREIAKIENGEMNPSFLILKAIIQVLHNSLDSLIISDGSADEGAEQMKMLYLILVLRDLLADLGNLLVNALDFVLSHFNHSFSHKSALPVHQAVALDALVGQGKIGRAHV